MKSYSEYIEESKSAKNTHLTHLEDLVFEGSVRAAEAISFLEEIAKMLDGNTKSKTNATVKWDGAPAIFCGTNPENGKFFVGSKSIFNKTPKINYTIADIRKNHPSGLGDKLAAALKYLKKLPIKGIMQGDMMFGPGDVGTKKIDSVQHYTFKPNTITYAVPVDSNLGRKINSAKMGIVFHTTYKGRKMSDLKASFGANVKGLAKNRSVWVDNAEFKDVSGTASLTASEHSSLNDIIRQAKQELKSAKSFLDEMSKETTIVKYLNTYVNSKVKEGTTDLSVKEFINWIDDNIQKDIGSLKTDAAIKRRESARDEMVSFINSKNKQMDSLFSLHSTLTKGKILLLRKLESVKSIGTFIQTSTGFNVTKPEGYVGIDRYSNNAVKFVDRLEFSRANFNVAKDWVKG